MTLIGLLMTLAGLAQQRSAVRQENPPPGALQPTRWPAFTAAGCCALACVLPAVYLALTAT
jgi:hypothetical protein